MAFVERLDEVNGGLTLSVDASRAAVAVDRFIQERPVDNGTSAGVESIIMRLDDELTSQNDDRRARGFVTLLTDQGGVDAFLGIRRRALSDEQRDQLEEIKVLLQKVVDDDHSADVAMLSAIRDSLAALAERARTYVHDFAELADAPEAEWISPTSLLF